MPRPVALVPILRRINKALYAKATRHRYWDSGEQRKPPKPGTTYLEIHVSNPYRTMNRRGDYYLMEVTKTTIGNEVKTTSKFKKGHIDIDKLAKQLGVLEPWEFISKKTPARR